MQVGHPSTGADNPYGPLLDQLASTAGHLVRHGWAEAHGGNISVLTDDLPDDSIPICAQPEIRLETGFPELENVRLVVSVTGSRMRDIAADPSTGTGLLWLGDRGESYRFHPFNLDDPAGRPTSELPTHLSLYSQARKTGRDVSAVLHTHPDHLVAITQLKWMDNSKKISDALRSMYPEAAIMLKNGLGFIPYSTPGSEELARATTCALKDHKIAVWAKHGAVVAAGSLVEALDLVEVADKAARIYILCRSTGQEPQGLDPGEIEQLGSMY